MKRLFTLFILFFVTSTTFSQEKVEKKIQVKTGAIMMNIIPADENVNADSVRELLNEMAKTMHDSQGYINDYITSGEIKSPSGPSGYLIFHTIHWESILDGLDWTKSANSNGVNYAAELKKLNAELLIYEVE